jgi:uncharacterized membrane protein (DUF485 family)
MLFMAVYIITLAWFSALAIATTKCTDLSAIAIYGLISLIITLVISFIYVVEWKKYDKHK